MERLKVVLVEDNEDAAETLCILMKRWGCDVAIAGDGERAVELILSNRPDLALVDIGLPLRNGYEVATAVKAHPDGAALHLVALTGYGQPEDWRRAQEAGFAAQLVKPVEPEALRRFIEARRAEVEGA